MAARQFRWLLLGELLIYAVLGAFLVFRCGWTTSQAGALALAGFFGLHLMIVALTFGIMLSARDAAPPALRIGWFGALRMFAEEYFVFVLMFVTIIPFERFWLGPDRLAHCATRRTPLLLIHGYQCNRGFWFWLRRKLELAGWTVATCNLEPVFADIDSYAQGIARRVDEVLAATGATQVLLVGHSMGGLAARAYLRRHGTEKVARLVTLGSPHQGTRLATLGLGRNARQMRVDSPWLQGLAEPGATPLPPGSVSIYSCHDNYVFPQQAGSTLAGATGVAIGGVGHLAMAISPLVLGKLIEALESPAP